MSSISGRKPLRFGIQFRLLLVTLAIGLLFVLYIAFNTSRQSARDLLHVREEVRLVASLAGARLDDHLGDVNQLLFTLSGMLPAEIADVEHNDAMLRRLAPQFPANVSSVSLWAPDGMNIGSSESTAAVPRLNAADLSLIHI